MTLSPNSCATVTVTSCKYNLVVDLDGTLICDNGGKTIPRATMTWRPGARSFLDWALDETHGHVGIWSAGCEWWVRRHLKGYRRRSELAFVWHRSQCILATDGGYTKPLAQLCEVLSWDPARTLIIDDSPASFVFNPEQAIHVPTFRGVTDGNAADAHLQLWQDVRDLLRVCDGAAHPLRGSPYSLGGGTNAYNGLAPSEAGDDWGGLLLWQ